MEELRKFSEFLTLARAFQVAHTGFIRNLVYRARTDRPELNKLAGKDLVSAAQLMSATFALLESYKFEDPELEQIRKNFLVNWTEANDILMGIAKQTAERLRLPVATSDSPISSREILLNQAKRSLGL